VSRRGAKKRRGDVEKSRMEQRQKNFSTKRLFKKINTLVNQRRLLPPTSFFLLSFLFYSWQIQHQPAIMTHFSLVIKMPSLVVKFPLSLADNDKGSA
jgi:hypothetical protein